MKLLARALDRAALYEDGRVVVSYLVRSDFGEVGAVEPYSEGIIDVLRAVEGAELAALIREPPRDGSPARKISLRSSTDRVDVSAIARSVRTAAATARRPGSRATSRSTRSPPSSSPSSRPCRPRRPERGAATRGDSQGPRADRRDPRRQAGRAVVVRRARRVCARERAPRPGTPARSTRSRPGSCFCCPVGQLRWPHASSACPSATSRTSISRGARRPAIPRARRSRRTSRRRPAALEAALAGLRGEIELPIPTASAVKIGGERAYQLHRQGRRGRDAAPALAGRRARRHRVYRRASRHSICVSAPGRTSGRSPMRSVATASLCGERKSGRSPSSEADAERGARRSTRRSDGSG